MAPELIDVWAGFIGCVAVIGVAGVQLTKYGDAIADKTGLGGTWIGLILMATVTSLPELASGITSVTAANVPEIAVGDVLGSCVYNLVILAIIDLYKRDRPLYSVASQGHILGAGFSVVLTGLVALDLALIGVGAELRLGHLGATTMAIFLLYAISMRTVFRFEKAQIGSFTEQEPDNYPELTLRRAALRYAFAAAFVVAAGIWLPYATADLAAEMGWKQSFAGTLFTAFATSLPELIVTLAAVRMNAIDMAIGNVLGSNLFNLLVLGVDDVLYLPGPLLAAVSPAHMVSAISTVIMTGSVIVGLFFRPRKRVLRMFSWTSILLLVIYLINSVALFNFGKWD